MVTKTIWKFKLEREQNQAIVMPRAAKILTVGVQGGEIMLWALVIPGLDEVARLITIATTGEGVLLDRTQYVGTVFWKALVLHVFDLGEEEL